MRTGVRWFLIAWTLVLLPVLGIGHSPAAAGDMSSQEAEVYAALEELAAYEIAALDQWWTPMFVNNGWREPEVFYHLLRPDEVLQLRCQNEDGSYSTISGTENNAVYCDVDRQVIDGVAYNGGIYLPIVPFVELLTTGEFYGRGHVDHPIYIPMAIIAHEFSHHVVAEIYHQANEERGIRLDWPGVPERELIADCLAGAFMLAFSEVGPLTADDVGGILDGLMLIADPETAEVSHGTPTQRSKAFSDGFYPAGNGTDTITTCYQNYWPDLLTALGNPSSDEDPRGAEWIPAVGETVVVAYDAVPLWSTLDADATMVGTLPYGMLVTVTADAVYDAEGGIWVGVATPDGYYGWVNLVNLAPAN